MKCQEKIKSVAKNCVVEICLNSAKNYRDPFNEIEVDAKFTLPDGSEVVVPTFWAGGKKWCVRYSSSILGRHTYVITSSDKTDVGLNSQSGEVEVVPYKGKNPLFTHGPLRVSKNGRYLEHQDGKEFFWLGDTWWMGLAKRLSGRDFQTLTADRVKKGFTVIQIVAGFYPDMPPYDNRNSNEGGFPWKKNYTRINPIYFNMADKRIIHLAESGLLPCIVGSWGYHIKPMGLEKMKKHWRYLVARYGAYPVVWCLAGEVNMPYYLSKSKEEDEKFQKDTWQEVARYLRKINFRKHPITVHAGASGRDDLGGSNLIDFDMAQTGHSEEIENIVKTANSNNLKMPRIPLIIAEACYEGIGGCNWENVQRACIWTSFLNGAAGYTYGANGIWQIDTSKKPYGPSPYGRSWGITPWEEAYKFSGSTQVGIARRILEKFPWWKIEPHPELVEPHWSESQYLFPYLATSGEVIIIYDPIRHAGWGGLLVKGLEKGASYRATYYDPSNGKKYELGLIKPDEKNNWQAPPFCIVKDNVLILVKVPVK